MQTDQYFFLTDQLQSLLDCLHNEGYQCVGPQVHDDAILYNPIQTVDQLPQGITDQQSAGRYRLEKNSSKKYFSWANGPQAIKPLLFAPREKLWQCTKDANNEMIFETSLNDIQPIALIGARACDLAAMKLQDQHFIDQQNTDPYYKNRRDKLLLVAVNCSHPAETCFCHSTGDGPFVTDAYDIALTELERGFSISAGSDQGQKILDKLSLDNLNDMSIKEEKNIYKNSCQQQKKIPDFDIRTALFNQLHHNAWHEIASQCLSCGNCTAVCPTCFCHSENEVPELDGQTSAHYREWDSCFSQGHSYIHGITIRSETSQRYRQWLTHKFSSWHQQYGRSGCVGCGRCITWCPVGIDVTVSLEKFTEASHDQ